MSVLTDTENSWWTACDLYEYSIKLWIEVWHTDWKGDVYNRVRLKHKPSDKRPHWAAKGQNQSKIHITRQIKKELN